jgi:hypothetical protein
MVSVSLQISCQKDPTWPNRPKPHPHHQLPNPQVRLALYIAHADEEKMTPEKYV